MVNLREIIKRVSKLLAQDTPQALEEEAVWVGNREAVDSVIANANEASEYNGDKYHLSQGVSKIVPLDRDSPRLAVEMEMGKFGQDEVRPVEIHHERLRRGVVMLEEVYCYLLATNGCPQVFFVSPIDNHSYNQWMALVHPHEAVHEAATTHSRL